MIKHVFVFMKKIPLETLTKLMDVKFNQIDIPKLMPAFTNIEKGPALEQALEYILTHCIKNRRCKDKLVHNLAIFFLTEQEKPEDLMDYLRSAESKKS